MVLTLGSRFPYGASLDHSLGPKGVPTCVDPRGVSTSVAPLAYEKSDSYMLAFPEQHASAFVLIIRRTRTFGEISLPRDRITYLKQTSYLFINIIDTSLSIL